MRVPFVIVRPKACCDNSRRNKFYRALLNDLPKAHKTRPGVKVAVHRLPFVLNYVIQKMRSKG